MWVGFISDARRHFGPARQSSGNREATQSARQRVHVPSDTAQDLSHGAFAPRDQLADARPIAVGKSCPDIRIIIDLPTSNGFISAHGRLSPAQIFELTEDYLDSDQREAVPTSAGNRG